MVLSFCSISTVVADDKASFKDLHGVGIVLEPLSPEVETAGLRKTDIQTDVELKLRLAGIPVLSNEEWTRTSGAPILYVNVSVFLSTTPDTWAFNIEADLSQDVKLVRGPAIIMPNATTWRTFVTGFAGHLVAVDYIRDSVKDQVDKFINAYLTMNPKQ